MKGSFGTQNLPVPPPVHRAWSIWFVPGLLAGKGAGLGEELPDFSVNVAKEVHVGRSAVQALVLHQELAEGHLRFVLLPHDLKLKKKKHFQLGGCSSGPVHQRATTPRLKLTFMELGLFSSRLLMRPRTFLDSGLSRTGRDD